MNRLEQALQNNGWSEAPTDNPNAYQRMYVNSGWPNSRIYCGGGFGGLRHLTQFFDMKAGGDYGILADLIEFAGPQLDNTRNYLEEGWKRNANRSKE